MMELKEDEANIIFEKMLSIEPKSADAYYGLAMNCSGSNPQQAIAYCKSAIEVDPKHAYSYNLLGLILRELDNISEALQYHKKSGIIKKNSGNCFYIGVLYHALGDLENAKKYFEESNYLAHKQIERVIQLHWALYMMGVIEGLFGKLTESKKLIKKALEYNSAKRIRQGMKSHLTFLLKYVKQEKERKKIKSMISYLGHDI